MADEPGQTKDHTMPRKNLTACPCGNPGVKFQGSCAVCQRCLAWEARAQYNRNGDRRIYSRPGSKYITQFRVTGGAACVN